MEFRFESLLMRSFRHLAALLGVASGIFFTAGEIPTRASNAPLRFPSALPSAVKTDPAARLLERDALEGLGLWIRSSLLERQLTRLEAQAKLMNREEVLNRYRPTFSDFGMVGGHAFLIGAGVGGSVTFISFFIGAENSTPAESRTILQSGGGTALIGSAGAVSILIGTADATHREHRTYRHEGKSAAAARRVRFGTSNSFDLEPAADALAEESNAWLQANFTAELKATAENIANRSALVLGLSTTERIALRGRLTKQLTTTLNRSQAWTPGTEVQVNLTQAFEKAIPDYQERLALLERLPEKSKSEGTDASLETSGSPDPEKFRKAYEGLISEAEASLKWATEKYEAAVASSDPAVARLERHLQSYLDDLDAYLRRLRTHSTF
jgi:hypothetical protein